MCDMFWLHARTIGLLVGWMIQANAILLQRGINGYWFDFAELFQRHGGPTGSCRRAYSERIRRHGGTRE